MLFLAKVKTHGLVELALEKMTPLQKVIQRNLNQDYYIIFHRNTK